jgi:hypothetical protein
MCANESTLEMESELSLGQPVILVSPSRLYKLNFGNQLYFAKLSEYMKATRLEAVGHRSYSNGVGNSKKANGYGHLFGFRK